MKISALQWLSFTTFILLTWVIFTLMNLDYSWVFFITILGQGLFVFTVYKVLTDDYKTDKNFRDFYEDRPDLSQ